MRTALILTLGFDERFCYRAILRHGVSEDDKIVLFSGRVVERVRRAYEWIRTFLRASYPNVETRLVELNVNDVIGSLERVLRVINELKGYRLIVNLSGGMRVLSMIVLFALILAGIRDLMLEVELEDFSGVVEIPNALLLLPSVKASMTEEKLAILKLIAEGKDDVRSIAESLGKDESTVRRHLAALEKHGLIKIEKRKPLKVRPSNLLSLMLLNLTHN